MRYPSRYGAGLDPVSESIRSRLRTASLYQLPSMPRREYSRRRLTRWLSERGLYLTQTGVSGGRVSTRAAACCAVHHARVHSSYLTMGQGRWICLWATPGSRSSGRSGTSGRSRGLSKDSGTS